MNAIAGATGGEQVDLIDEHDRVLGVVSRAEMRAGRLLHRCVFVAVVHPDGRLLVHRRSEHKDVWPGWFDIAVGGVVAAGEGYDAAARREVAEEVGLDNAGPVAVDDGVARLYRDDMVALLGRCYRVEHPGPFTFADGEVVEARWVDRAELAHLLATERFLPDSLALLLPLLDD
ncbi:MAG: NUDIX domain-containing protein [Actinomycetota bacterium]